MTLENDIRGKIRDVPDFPKKGIIFKDISPLLADGELFQKLNIFLAERYKGKSLKYVIGLDARGFIFGSAVAQHLGVGFIPIRKEGKLPYETFSQSYDLEYGSATIEMHIDAVKKGDRVVIVDDLLATGGTASAACQLLQKQGAQVLESAFVIELGFLNGREKLSNMEVFSLIKY